MTTANKDGVIIPLSICDWNKNTKTIVVSIQKVRSVTNKEFFGRYPRKVMVRSHHTGQVKQFVPVQPGDKNFCEDGWDGVQQLYAPVDRAGQVEYLCIHEFE